MRVFDCVTFAGIGAEWDLLEWRIRELQHVVNCFVVVAGDRTFQGAPHDAYTAFKANRFAFVYPRVLWGLVPLPEQAGHPMDREIVQRNGILDFVRRSAEPDDLILVSDVDEIPSAAAVTALKTLHSDHPALVWQALYHGWLNMKCLTEPWWPGTHSAPARWFDATQGRTPQSLRLNRGLPAVHEGGWHFSFLGGVEAYQEKLSSWSHVEWDIPPYNTTENIAAALREGRDWDTSRGMEYAFVPLDETYPRWIWEHRTDPQVARHISPAHRIAAVSA